MFSKNIFKILGLILFSIYLTCPFKCNADMVTPGSFATTPIFYFFAFIPNFLINFAVLIIIFLIFRQISLVKTKKFIKYVFFVTLGGFFIDLIYVIPKYIIGMNKLFEFLSKNPGNEFFNESEVINEGIIINSSPLPIFIFLTLVCLIIYNYWLSKKIFNFAPKKAFLAGLLIGILTCPIYSPLYIIGKYILKLF